MTILDELDLYRPTYKALTRILEETHSMRIAKCDHEVIRIIEDTLYECIIDWLSWDFTYTSSPWPRRIGFWFAKIILKFLKLLNIGLEIKAIASLMKFMSFVFRWNPFHKPGLSYKEMARFPSFMPAYEHYQFQIHGEGHTHIPLEEDPKFKTKRPTTYVNFGTWRDQIVARKESGYRRRSVLRAFFILDLKEENGGRSFKYLTDDITGWSDTLDDFSREDQS